jgi:dephospho-CoA kinase
MIIVITGVMAAGKSTVAQLLAESLDKSVHLRGDIFRRMIVRGRAETTPTPSREAEDQLLLRYALSARAADTYAAAGLLTGERARVV